MATQPTSSALVRFADFQFDLRTGDLHRDGVTLKLQPQPAKVLVMLVSRAGEIVTRQELVNEVWGPETFVDFEQGLNFAIRQIRAALEDDPDHPRFVQTLPKRGYRFIGQTQKVPSELPMPVMSVPEGGQETVRPFAQQAKRRWQSASKVGIVRAATILVVACVLLFGLRSRVFHATPPSPSPYAFAIHSIAVLPLDNLSKDSGQDYFSDGITDALTTELAQIGSLRVISRTSAMHFKGSRETLTEIGHQLNVEGIVEGSITRSENRVRITAQLIDVHSDRHLWAKTYEKDLKDVLDLQDEVARDIVAEIRIKLTPQEQSRLTASRETNPEAYDAYLRGRYLLGQRNAEAITKALGYFQQALQEEPDFAPVYSGLSDCYSVGWGAKRDLPLAEAYARKALSLQPDLAEGHTSLAMADLMQHKMADADDELRRALELNPNYAMAHHFHAGYLLGLGRPTDALAENDRARQLDPFSIPINMMRAMILTGLREYGQVLYQLERTAEIAPQNLVPHNFLARIYWLQGRVPEAIAEERKAGTLAHSSERLHDLKEVAAAYATSGLRAARVKSAQLMERHQNGNYEAIFVALQYGTLENEAKVLHWLERSSSANEGNFVLLTKTAPEFDFLQANPRFQDLLRRAGLPP